MTTTRFAIALLALAAGSSAFGLKQPRLQSRLLKRSASIVSVSPSVPAEGGASPPASSATLFALAICTGGATALAVFGFKKAVLEVSALLHDSALDSSGDTNWALPLAGGIGVALLRLAMPPAAFDSGISKSVEQATAGEPVDGGGAVVRAAAGVVTLGAGCSLGPEGPSVELGTTISRVALLAASALGAGELRPAQRRSLACAGTAAGVAAGFNAPLAAVAFAYEVAAKLRPFSVAAGNGDGAAAEPRPSFAPIALASGSAALAMRVLLSDGSLSFMPSLAAGSAVSLVDLPTFVLLGTCCGGGAVVFRLGLSRARSLFAGPVSARLGKPLQPIAGSVACAVIAAAVPQVEFSSYETLDGLVSEWSTLSTPANPLVLYAGKLVATCLCAGSGLVGGIFAPSLFLGAALGAAFSQATSEFTALLGAHVVDASDLILVGAASVLAAVFSSPITSALLVFDLTHDAQLLLPSLVAATVATALCDELAQN